MKKSVLYVMCVACLMLTAAHLHAQSGCEDSPENPTIILALVGSAGGLFTTLRSRIKSRRNRSL